MTAFLKKKKFHQTLKISVVLFVAFSQESSTQGSEEAFWNLPSICSQSEMVA